MRARRGLGKVGVWWSTWRLRAAAAVGGTDASVLLLSSLADDADEQQRPKSRGGCAYPQQRQPSSPFDRCLARWRTQTHFPRPSPIDLTPPSCIVWNQVLQNMLARLLLGRQRPPATRAAGAASKLLLLRASTRGLLRQRRAYHHFTKEHGLAILRISSAAADVKGAIEEAERAWDATGTLAKGNTSYPRCVTCHRRCN